MLWVNQDFSPQEKVFSPTMGLLTEAREQHQLLNYRSKMPPKPLTQSRKQLLEFVQILQPIADATDVLQSDKVTSSAVIPSLLGIYEGKWE